MAALRRFLLFVRAVLRAQFSALPPREILSEELEKAGWGSMGLLTILTIFTGLNLSVQSYEAFERFGGQDMLGTFAAIGGVRELYPVLAALICGSKIGAKVAASLANMRISEQIEALEVMAVDPMHRLIAPRMWAVTLAMPLLCVYADCIGLAASYYGAVYQLDLDGGSFMTQLREQVGWSDLGVGLLKGLVMGWAVALVACYHGYTIAKRDGAEGVGVATNLAIVKGAVLCITINLLLSYLIYG